MNERTLKSLLWLASAVMVLVMAFSLIWVLRGPGSVDTGDRRAVIRTSSDDQDDKKILVTDEPALSELEQMWKKDLRPTELFPPNYTPPEEIESVPSEPVIQAPPRKPLNVKLLATAIEADGSYAVFEDNEQKIQVIREGDEIDSAIVTRIWANGVRLDHDGEEVNLILQNDYNGATSPSYPSPSYQPRMSPTPPTSRPGNYRRPPQRRP